MMVSSAVLCVNRCQSIKMVEYMALQQKLMDMLAQVARAMGHGHRLALLERLAQAEASVETLAASAELTIGNTSQHLQQLRRAGLVTADRNGKQMIYRLTDDRIITLLSLLRQVAETNLAEMERLISQLFADDDATGALEPVASDEMLAGLKTGKLVLLDVRPEEEFHAGHLPQAINIPLEQLDTMLHKLPKTLEIVAYCRGPYCTLSHKAVQCLRHLGYRVRRFEEGYPEWKAAGLPVEL